MRKYSAPFIAVFAIIVVVGIWLYRPTARQTLPPNLNVDTPNAAGSASPRSSAIRTQMPGGPYEPGDPRWAEVHLKDRTDKGWEWKMPISFYGKVVDQDDQPVPGASVNFCWTNISKNGSEQSSSISDWEGKFKLENKYGRVLIVTVSKPGYYTAKKLNQVGFDYAGFWEKTYYQPNSKTPVIFHLRKHGVIENLLTRQSLRPGEM